MADVCGTVSPDATAASPSKCREARRRRIEARRSSALPGLLSTPARRRSSSGSVRAKRTHASTSTSGSNPHRPSLTSSSSSASSSPSSSSSSGTGLSEGGDRSPRDAAGPSAGSDDPARVGWISLSGRSREMEDAITVLPRFFSPSDPFHFFGVFDGHGGSHVSALCRDRMHACLAEELRAEDDDLAALGEEGWRRAMRSCFRRVDDVAMASCACGRVPSSPPCRCEKSGMTSEIVGSTAVVAVVGPQRVVVANCGDSRAVLSRAGRAVPLSDDHKPDRADELARIEAAGGRVIVLNGGARVLGILAMSRAVGDKYLKPLVISDPEITITERTLEDECLIIASDGLWDVLSNDLACEIARHCLYEGDVVDEAEASSDGSDARCMLAATLLTRLALGRMCLDNISVIVVDLRRDSQQGSDRD